MIINPYNRPYELCCVCGEATGRAGKAEDSLYIDEDGPFCEECYDDVGGDNIFSD